MSELSTAWGLGGKIVERPRFSPTKTWDRVMAEGARRQWVDWALTMFDTVLAPRGLTSFKPLTALLIRWTWQISLENSRAVLETN
jgi:hypothetical protein